MLTNNLDYIQYVLVTSTTAAPTIVCMLPVQLAKGFIPPDDGIGY
jgi:hypothetical protein